MTVAAVGATRAERAIWGLVDDRYDVAARTPPLTAEGARRLCRVADMGDPAAPLDDAVAYLVAPEWGPVCARYYTNAQRDSSGRLTIVYDVVRPSNEMMVSARFNPFRVFPAPSANRTIEHRGELAAPLLVDGIEDAARLRALLLSIDERLLVDVLAAVLAGGPALWLNAAPLAAIEAIVLLLPAELRERFTFQSYTLARPAYLPTLTVAEQQVGSLRDASWSVVLPRDRATLPAGAVSASASLIELAGDADRLARAHRTVAKVGDPDRAETLLGAIDRMLRLERFFADRDRSDIAAALTAVADAPTEGERAALGAEVVSAFEPSELAASIAGLVERTPAAGWSAIGALVPILQARSATDPTALTTLNEIVARVAGTWLPDDTASTAGRALLARFAAATRQSDAAILLLPRAATDGGSGKPDAGTPLARFVELALAPRPTIGAVRDLTRLAVSIVGELSSRRASQRLSILQFAAVRRAIAASGLSCHASELESLRRDVLGFWERCAPAGELDTAAKRLLAAPGERTVNDARAVALSLGRDGEPAGIAETMGWIRLLLQATDGAAAAAAFASACAMTREIAPHIGALVRAALPPERSSLLQKHWTTLLDLADACTRRDLLVEALGDAIAHASADGPVGVIADACVALGERGIRLDGETGRPIVAAIVRMRGREVPADAALRLRIVCAAVEQIGDDAVADAIAASVWTEGAGVDVVGGRLFLASAALRAVERIRPAASFAAFAAAASADLSWRSALPAEHARRITRFLRLGGTSSLAALIRRELPDEAESSSPSLSPR